MNFTRVLVVWFFLVVLCHGVTAERVLSEEEDLELERQLKILNKPAIKTFQNEVGDVIDCVDIYKQPAFDHHLLKNHKIQMAPSSSPKEVTRETSPASNDKYFETSDTDECPEGTIPIIRVTKEHLMKANSFMEIESTIHTEIKKDPRKQNALVRTEVDRHDVDIIIGKGVQGDLEIYDPIVDDNTSSRNHVSALHDLIETGNFVSAGWIVAPQLYGKLLPRSYISWGTFGPKPGDRKGCFNHLCPGFVQIDQQFVLGNMLKPTIYGSKVSRYIVFRLRQDTLTGNWWVEIPTSNRKIGYWPSEILPLLTKGPNRVKWGGITMGYPDGRSPQMGSGHFPDGQHQHGCYVDNMLIVDHGGNLVLPAPPLYETEVMVSDIMCYRLDSYTYTEENGFTFLFGGPGGRCKPY